MRILVCLFMMLLAFSMPVRLHAEPAYAKWGALAVQETKKRYNADIIDYLHLGRKPISPDISEESFRLWLKDPSGEFGVIVRIRFRNDTEEVLSIRMNKLNLPSFYQPFDFSSAIF
ncbi:DUF3889 domain-containing protein [Paenibacillus sp. NPDC056579]|uniref:DUF3889 domain-containing protein n=1 Tax=unclassified Paenibacillus TaxID=185978 RepID=UPI001EF81BA6|nr:DUF3889 domain-containing protein [Paenibacillus sp. H1-7]ULL13199.1 DUF3889 domain-containing protein [Paenibacillus sp. H1-7]